MAIAYSCFVITNGANANRESYDLFDGWHLTEDLKQSLEHEMGTCFQICFGGETTVFVNEDGETIVCIEEDRD